MIIPDSEIMHNFNPNAPVLLLIKFSKTVFKLVGFISAIITLSISVLSSWIVCGLLVQIVDFRIALDGILFTKFTIVYFITSFFKLVIVFQAKLVANYFCDTENIKRRIIGSKVVIFLASKAVLLGIKFWTKRSENLTRINSKNMVFLVWVTAHLGSA